MKIPNTPSMQHARCLYDAFISTLDVDQTYSMEEFNKLLADYVTKHGISELDHDNMLEIKYDHMLTDGDGKMPTHNNSH